MTVPTPPVHPRVYWRPGDDLGARRLAEIGAVNLELGGVLPEVTVAFETWGTLNAARDNAILVLHALTGDSHVSGHQPALGWAASAGPETCESPVSA